MVEASGILSLYANELSGFATFCGRDCPQKEASCTWTPDYRQAIGFVPLIQNLANQVGTPLMSLWDRLDTIIVPKGPTSFTTLRITLSVAQAIAFSLPNVRVFAPSQFHVVAYGAESVIGAGTVIILLNAFKPGFYGGILSVAPSTVPYFLDPPAYYSPEMGTAFLEKHASLPVFSNLPKGLDIGQRAQPLPNMDFAQAQIDLFQRQRSLKDTFDYTSLNPFYLDTPTYKKEILK